MPAPTRARLADLGLQGLDPKKKHTKIGKDGLFVQATKVVAQQEPEDLPVVAPVAAEETFQPILEAPNKQEEPVPSIVLEKEEQVLQDSANALESEEKKDSKMPLKKQQKKIFTAP